MTDDPVGDPSLEDVELRAVRSSEYDLSAVATATIDGAAGRLRIRRRYEALPRHNDVVDVDAIDSNDELLDRSDAIHVHTRVYAVDDGSFVLDSHETWTPDGVSTLAAEDAFLAACRDHHVADADRAYAQAAAER